MPLFTPSSFTGTANANSNEPQLIYKSTSITLNVDDPTFNISPETRYLGISLNRGNESYLKPSDVVTIQPNNDNLSYKWQVHPGELLEITKVPKQQVYFGYFKSREIEVIIIYGEIENA
jgi:hypothetical protein